MSDLSAAPSSTEPTAEELALIAMGTSAQEAGTAASGEIDAALAAAGSGDISATTSAANAASGATQGAADVGGGVDASSHLLMLDAMLAEIERKIAAGIHLFAHEVTAARDHLAKLL